MAYTRSRSTMSSSVSEHINDPIGSNWYHTVLYRAQKASVRLPIQMLRLVTCFFEVQLNICTGQLLDPIAISPQVGRGQLTQSDSCLPSHCSI